MVINSKVFIHISPNGLEHSFLTTPDLKRYFLNFTFKYHTLQTGIYFVIDCEITNDTVTFNSDDEYDFVESISHNATTRFNDFAKGTHPEDGEIIIDNHKRFALLGMVVGKRVPWKGGDDKSLYEILTLANIVVTVEVWFLKGVDNYPKIGETIEIQNCYVATKPYKNFVQTKPNDGFMWYPIKRHLFVDAVFKTNISTTNIKVLISTNKYHYKRFGKVEVNQMEVEPFENKYKTYSDEDKKRDADFLVKSSYFTRTHFEEDSLQTIECTIIRCYPESIKNMFNCRDCGWIAETNNHNLEEENCCQFIPVCNSSECCLSVRNTFTEEKTRVYVNNMAIFIPFGYKDGMDIGEYFIKLASLKRRMIFYVAFRKKKFLLLNISLV